MLCWALAFFVITIWSGVAGFGGGPFSGVGRVLFVAFLVLTLAALISLRRDVARERGG